MSSSPSRGSIDEQIGLDSCLVNGPAPATADAIGSFSETNVQNSFVRFLREEEGATAVEYAVMVSLIAATCIAGFQALTTATVESFDTSAAELAK